VNVLVAIVVAVKAAIVVGVASLALVQPASATNNVQRPATLDVVTSDDARTCYAMGGRFVGNEICKDVDY
jgi:hypothetical protein